MKAVFVYSIVTEESAQYGDTSERGWVLPGMWEFALEDEDGYHEEVLKEAREGKYNLDDLSEVINFAQSLGISYHDGEMSTQDEEIDLVSGERTMYVLHLEDVTPSTYNRVGRYLNGE